MLKVSLGGDSRVSPGGSEAAFAHTRAEFEAGGVFTRGYTFWLMREARQRNPAILIYALSYSRPSWVGGGFFFSLDSIDYNVKWLEAANTMGTHVDYMGLYNERYYGKTEGRWIKLFRKALDNSTAHGTQIVAADMCCTESWKIAALMSRDGELNASIAAIGGHYPAQENGGNPHGQLFASTGRQAGSNMPTDDALGLGTPLWASEDWVFGHTLAPVNGDRLVNTTRGDWAGATVLASQLNGNYVHGRMTATNIWNAMYGMYTTEEPSYVHHSLAYVESPWAGTYSINPALQIVGHWTIFTEPGWRYLKRGAGSYLLPGGAGTITTLARDDGNDMEGGHALTIIIETMNTTRAQELSLRVQPWPSLLASSTHLHAWRSVDGQLLTKGADVVVGNGGQLPPLVLPAASILTLTTVDAPPRPLLRPNQTTGERRPAPFPRPYTESFNTGYAVPRLCPPDISYFLTTFPFIRGSLASHVCSCIHIS